MEWTDWKPGGRNSVVGEADPLLSESIDSAYRCSPEWTPAVAAQLAESEIVDAKEQDIRSLSSVSLRPSDPDQKVPVDNSVAASDKCA